MSATAVAAPSPPPSAPPPPATRPSAPPPPPSISRPAPNGKPTVASKSFRIGTGVNTSHQAIVVYGEAGAGKSELCANIKKVGMNPLFIDIGRGTQFLDVARIPEVGDPDLKWEDVRSILHNQELIAPYDCIVIDDLTKAEELAKAWTVENIPDEKKNGGKVMVANVEGYSWGKGPAFVYDTFLQLLGDLDAVVRSGKQVICIAHECINEPENPGDDNYSMYQPRLQHGKKGQNSIRARVKEWCSHMFFVSFDVFVDERGKGIGSGTRTIHTSQTPAYWAKSRLIDKPIPYERGSAELWSQLFKKS